MSETASFAGLPMILRQIAEESSLEAALRLAEAKGGMKIYVPKRLSEAHGLVDCMGEEGARALCRLYGGEDIIVPLDPRGGQRARVRAIRRGISEGKSANEVARSAGVGRRHIFWHKARMKKSRPRRQKDLFDD